MTRRMLPSARESCGSARPQTPMPVSSVVSQCGVGTNLKNQKPLLFPFYVFAFWVRLAARWDVGCGRRDSVYPCPTCDFTPRFVRPPRARETKIEPPRVCKG